VALYPLSAFRAMAQAASAVYREIRARGTQRAVLPAMQTREELYAVLGYHEYERKLDELFAGNRERRSED
jgi:methylisocitrate lyase